MIVDYERFTEYQNFFNKINGLPPNEIKIKIGNELYSIPKKAADVCKYIGMNNNDLLHACNPNNLTIWDEKLELCKTPKQSMKQKFIDYCKSKDPRSVRHLTYNSITTIIGCTRLEALIYIEELYTDGYIEEFYEFYQNGSSTEFMDISYEEYVNAIDNKEFYNPETGELVDNPKESVFKYFKPTDKCWC